MRPLSAAFAAVLVLAAASAALAHPRPKSATPTPDAILATSPAQISLTFNEALVPAFSGLELKDQAGKSLALGPASVDRKGKKTLSAPVTAKLAAGTYTVFWRAVGDDTHHVSGHYSFQVKP